MTEDTIKEMVLVMWLSVVLAVVLLVFQNACVEHSAANDAFYLEKFRIEEAN